MTIRRIATIGALLLGFLSPALSYAALTVTPLTWNVIGLDSNDPATGPQYFPVGARVCSSSNTTNVVVDMLWDSANANIDFRAGSLNSLTFPSIAAGACVDAYFSVEVNRVAAAFDTTRRYRITATDGSGSASTPVPRELYVEHLISQNRNSITGIKLDGVTVPFGGAMNLVVGNTYSIELTGGTATQGYNQFEAFINFPNTIFQILSVNTLYSANNSPYVANPTDRLYADACLWDNNPASPNYLSCVGGDFKTGGTTVVTTYTVKILSGGGTSEVLNTLLYDFSGSSFHYNSDASSSVVIANISDPSALGFSKAFSPTPTVAGGTSTLTFTIVNPNTSAIGGASFSDTLPLLSGSQMVVATPAVFSTSGCGAPTFTPVAGASSVSFADGTVAANGSCVVNVQVSVPSTPTTGSYANVSGNLFVGGIDSGKNATAGLGLTTSPPPTNVCGLTLAQWTMPTAAGTSAPPAFSFKAGDVASATAVAGSGITSTINTAEGNPVNSWQGRQFLTSATLDVADNEYFQFAVTTTNYTSIGFQFDAKINATGPTALRLYSSTDGTTFTPYGSVLSPTSSFATYNPAFSGTANTGGLTYFRIYGYASGNNGNSEIYIDNISVTGCQPPQPPTLTKTFLTNPVAVGGTSTLRFTITNSNTAPLTGIKFTDSLPAGLQVAATPAASTTCGGSPSWAPTAGATTLDFGQTTGASLAASSSCTVDVDVTATTAGPHVNVSGFVSSTESGTNSGPGGSAVASLTALRPPTIAKSFGSNPILEGGTSVMSVVITNPNPNNALAGVAFADAYPAGLVNSNPLTPAVTNTCAGTVTATAGGNSLGLSGGALAAGASCTITVPVTSATVGDYVNVTGAVSATTAGTGNTATATLAVDAPAPAIGLLKRVGTSATGPWSAFLSVAPGTPLYYQFTAENTGDVTFSTFGVTDPTLAGTAADPAACSWSTLNVPTTLPALPVGTATIDPTATCVVGPVAAAAGAVTNTATAHGNYAGAVYDSSPAAATYVGAPPGFSLLKQIGPSSAGPWSNSITVTPSSNVYYRFLLTNTGAVALSSVNVTDALVSTASCAFTDPLPIGASTICVVGPAIASGTVGNVTTNTATGHGTTGAGVIDTAPSSAIYSVNATTADLAVTKSNGTTTVTAGGNTTYAITVTNNGPGEVTNATLADTAPAALTFGNWTCAVNTPGTAGAVTTACGAASGSGNINTTVNLQVGGVIVFTVPAAIGASATGTISNTATVAVPAGMTDPVPANNTATDTDTVTAPPVSANLAVTKTDNSLTYAPGGSGSYTVTVTNAGPGNAAAVTVADTLPAGVTLNGTVTCAVTGAAGCGTVTGTSGQTSFGATGAAIAGGAGNALIFTVPVAYAVTLATSPLVNTATAADPASPNASGSDSSTRAPVVALTVVKTDGSLTYTPGGTATYAVTVTNAGPSNAVDVTLADTLPAGVTLTANVMCTANGAATCGTVTGTTGQTSLGTTGAALGAASGDSLVFSVPVAFAPGMTTDPLVNTATATDVATGATANGSDSNAFAAQVTLAVVKTDGSATYTPGGTATYTVSVTNSGVSTATNVTVADPLPAGVVLSGNVTCLANGTSVCGTVAGTTGQGSFGSTGAQVAPGAGNSLVFTAPVSFGAGMSANPLVNTATADDGPSGATGSGSDSNTLAAQVTLVVAKTDNSPTYAPGGAATYVVTVTNTGTSNALNVTVNDVLPTGVTLTGTVTCTANGAAACGTVTGTSGQGSFGATLAAIAAGPGNSLVFTVPVAFAANLVDDPLVNTATATDVPSGATASGSDSNARSAVASLAVTKTDGSLTYTPGGTATYAVTVTNAGPSNAVDVTLADTLPAGVTLTANVMCTANGAATCGTVTGTTGQTSLGTTGAALGAASGDSLVFSVPVAFAPGMTTDPLVNTATATDVATGATANGSDSNAFAAQVTLAVVKTDGSATYTPGGTATYTVSVTNSGVSTATNVTVADVFPTGVTLTGTVTCTANGTAACGTVTGTSGQGSFGATLAAIAAGPGNSLVFTVPVAFAANLVDDPLVNTATATDVPSGATASGSDSNARSAVASLAVVKTDNSLTYAPGGSGSYTVTVTNAGPGNAAAVTVADTLPAGVTLNGTVTCAVTGAAGCGTVTGTSGQTSFGATGAAIAGGAGNALIFTVPVAYAVTLATSPLVNTATAADPASPNASGSDSSTRAPVVALTVVKTDGSLTYTPGGTATYAVTVTNAGPSNAVDVTLADTLPAGVTLTANVMCTANGAATCGTVTGTTGQTSLGTTGAALGAASGDSLVFSVPVAFAPGMTTDPLVNTATATDVATGATANGSDSNAFAAQVTLAVVKTDGSATYTPGGTATYTVSVTNSGVSTATNVTVADPLPAGVVLSGNVTCLANGTSVCGTVAGTTGQGSFGSTGAQVAPGAGNSLVFTAPVSFGAGMSANPLVNTATADDGPSGATGSGSDSNTLAAQVTLVVAKTDNSPTYAPGGAATYVVTVTNTGTSNALNVTVNDVLPTGVTLTGTVTCTANGAAACGTVTGTSGQGSFGATLAAIAAGPGNSLVFSVPVAFAANLVDDPLVNTATATDVPSGATASGSDSNARSAVASLAVTKTDGSATYTPGGTATYTVVVTNAGPSVALAVAVSDALPAGVTLNGTVSCTATGISTCGTVTGTAGQTSFGTTGAIIAAGVGNSLTFVVPVQFAAGMTANPLVNTVTATDPQSPPATAADSDVLQAIVSLALTKSDGSTTYVPGGTATYSILVTNTGVSTATNLSVNDSLPAGVTLTGNMACTAFGNASCGAVFGTAGQSVFGTTGATIDAGLGNSLQFTAPVGFAASLTTDPLVNTVTATDLGSGATGSASDSNGRGIVVVGPTQGKTIVPSTISSGGAATLTLALGNPNATPITLTADFVDPMPAGVTATSGNAGTCTGVTVTPTSIAKASGSTIPPGGCTIVVTITSTTTGTVINTTGPLQTSAGAADPASAPLTVAAPVANLTITKTNNQNSVTPGSSVTYVIVATNGGPAAVTGAMVTDNLPPQLSGVTWTCIASAGSSCPAAGSGNLSVPVNLLVGGTATFTVTGTLSSSATGTLTNTATVAPPPGVVSPGGGGTATDSDPIVAPNVDLAIAKVHVGVFTAGQIGAQYRITVSNAGSTPSVGVVTVTDLVPAGLTATAIGGAGWTCAQPAGPCSRGDPLPPGASYPVITLTVNVDANAPSPLTNVAKVAGGGDAGGGNDTAQDTVTLGLPSAQPIPVGTPMALLMLVALLGLFGGRRLRTTRVGGGRR